MLIRLLWEARLEKLAGRKRQSGYGQSSEAEEGVSLHRPLAALSLWRLLGSAPALTVGPRKPVKGRAVGGQANRRGFGRG